MAVRNFWVEADISGRSTMLAGGPTSKVGEMTIRLFQRDNGSIATAFRIQCTERNGRLMTQVIDGNGYVVGEFVSER